MKDHGPPRRREKSLLFIPMASKQKKTLSIFVDEGGDFGPADPHSPLYVVSFVLHDQSVDLGPKISYLSELVANCGYPGHAIHTYPLIRREAEYKGELSETGTGSSAPSICSRSIQKSALPPLSLRERIVRIRRPSS